MKNSFFLGLISIFMLSCNNEDNTIEKQDAPAEAKIKLVSFQSNGENARGGTLSSNMLEFENWQDFEETANMLDQQVEVYDDAFVAQYNNLTLDQLNDKEVEVKFNNQQPLINFENSIGFTNSLRKRFNTENEIYLNDEVLDESKNPNLTLAFSNGELSLVNDKQQVKIGNEVFAFNQNGYVSISQDYENNLVLLASNSPTLASQTGVTVANSNTNNSCSGWKATGTPHPYASDKFAQRVAKIRSVPSFTKTEKMTIHYEKRRRNRWREARTRQSVDIAHNLSDINCNKLGKAGYKPMNTYKKKKRRDIHLSEWGNPRLKAENGGGLSGNHKYNGIVTYYTLSW